MLHNETKRSWGQAVPYIFGGFLCLLAVAIALAAAPWYLSVGMLGAAIIIMAGQRRILRPGVARAASEIVCRYIPWYEGNSCIFFLALPMIGVAMDAAGRDPGTPPWFRFGGIFLLCMTALMLWIVVRVWRRSGLRISPSALTISSGTVGSKLTEIRRDQIASITPMIVTTGTSKSLQTEIAYHPLTGHSGDNATETILLGLQLTVRPIDLANALTSWNDADVDDPDELLDLIEQVLRGGRPAIPAKPSGDGTSPDAPRDRSDAD